MSKKPLLAATSLLVLLALALTPYALKQISVATRIKILFEQSYELGNLSPKTQQDIGAGNDPLAKANLKSQLEATYVPEEARRNFDAILKMFKEDNGQALDSRFDKVDFQILWWEGSSENEGVLVATFTGITKITTRGQTRDGSCLGRYEVKLRKATPGGDWLLSSWKLDEFSNCR
jgi:hypothetical protein